MVWRVLSRALRETPRQRRSAPKSTPRTRGLVVIGMNPADEKPIFQQFLADKGVTFPNILDTTPAGWDLFANQYQNSERTGMTAVPLNYVINRDAVIACSQYGFNEQKIREAILRQLA